MTVKYSKFPCLCRNCGNRTEGGRYFRMGSLSFVLCTECAELMVKQIRSMSDAGKKQVEQ
jgi:hypothetical protein